MVAPPLPSVVRRGPEGGSLMRRSLHLLIVFALIASMSALCTATASADPVVAAAGDIACDPDDPDFNAGAGTPGHCQQRATSDLLVAAPTRRRASAGRHPVRQRLDFEHQRRVPPQLGAREVDQPADRRQPRGQRNGLLRLLQRPGRCGRARRPAGQGLLQLRRRRLAPRRPQLELLARRLLGRLGTGAMAAGRPRRSSRRVHPRLLAPSAFQLGSRRQQRQHAGALAGAPRGRRRDPAVRPQPQLRAFCAARPEWLRRPGRGHPPVRGRHRGSVLHRVAYRRPSPAARSLRTTPSEC